MICIESSESTVLGYHHISPERKYTIQKFIVAWSFAVATVNNDIVIYSMNKKRSITTLVPSLFAVTILTIIVFTTVLVVSTTSSTNNNNHHLGVVVASSSLIPSANAQTRGNNNTTTSPVGGGNATSAALDCSTIPPKIGAKAVSIPNPNREVCDIVILRESPQIKSHNGTILNKFLAINSLVEVTTAPPNITATIKTRPQSPIKSKSNCYGRVCIASDRIKTSTESNSSL